LVGKLEVTHRPGCELEQEAFIGKLVADRSADLARGYTHHGPHRGDLLIRRAGRDVKEHASQGEKRIALLALILAEREAIAEAKGTAPILLLDDVMSELDSKRRELLVRRVSGFGQCLITATEFEHVPDVAGPEMRKVSLAGDDDHGLRAA
jgi:DNA replication and repair protein RecF